MTSEQKPSVGRMVHFYGTDLRWHINMAHRTSAQKAEDELSGDYPGPFTATIVLVHGDGRVNLRVDYPTPLWGSADVSEIVVAVPHESLANRQPRRWVWPPRVS